MREILGCNGCNGWGGILPARLDVPIVGDMPGGTWLHSISLGGLYPDVGFPKKNITLFRGNNDGSEGRSLLRPKQRRKQRLRQRIELGIILQCFTPGCLNRVGCWQVLIATNSEQFFSVVPVF